jgi:hypothetical protein
MNSNQRTGPLTVSLISLLMLVVVLIQTMFFYLDLSANLSNLGLSDLGIYQIQFNNMIKFGAVTHNTDFGFYYLMYFFTQWLNFELFVTACFFLFYASLIKTFYSLCDVKWLVFIVFLVLFFYPMYQSLSSLVLRQGLGFAFLFVSAFFFRSHLFVLSAAKVALASLFHLSMLFYVPVLLVNRFISSLKLLVLFWCITVVLYVCNIPLAFVNFLPADLAGAVRAFSMVEDNYVTGFKPLFLILSVVPFLFLLLRPYYYYVCKNQMMFEMLKIFFVANSAGLLFSGFPYYDRVMLFSWVLVPLVMMNFVSFLFPRQTLPAEVYR